MHYWPLGLQSFRVLGCVGFVGSRAEAFHEVPEWPVNNKGVSEN